MSVNSFSFRRIRRRAISRDASNPAKKEAPQEQFFFGSAGTQPAFFQPAIVHRKCEACTEEENKVQKQEESGATTLPSGTDAGIRSSATDENTEEKPVAELYTEGKGTGTENKVSYGCEGIEVEGKTVANYDQGNYQTKGKTKKGETCEECLGNDCITFTGNLISVFTANPVITLPNVPEGLSPCEKKAVRTFIQTTLKNHELDHVTAFKTYNGQVKTPLVYTGCREDFRNYVQDMHDRINQQRIETANQLSDQLDPFHKEIPCDCPGTSNDAVKPDDKETVQEKK